VLAFIDPLMYGVDGLRHALLGAGSISIWICLLALLIFNAIMIALATRFFREMTA
jgi:ABC-type multidrug transport system permease subunit